MVDEIKKNGNADFGARLSKAIDHSGKSMRQIALAIGVQPQSATKWKTLGYLAKERIPAFCRETGVTMEWLLSGGDDLVESNPLRKATEDEVISAALNLPVHRQGSLIHQLAVLISQARDSDR